MIDRINWNCKTSIWRQRNDVLWNKWQFAAKKIASYLYMGWNLLARFQLRPVFESCRTIFAWKMIKNILVVALCISVCAALPAPRFVRFFGNILNTHSVRNFGFRLTAPSGGNRIILKYPQVNKYSPKSIQNTHIFLCMIRCHHWRDLKFSELKPFKIR